MKWNNTLVILLISGLQVIVFTELHEISCVIRNISIAAGSNYFVEPMCMKLVSLPFQGVQKSCFTRTKGMQPVHIIFNKSSVPFCFQSYSSTVEVSQYFGYVWIFILDSKVSWKSQLSKVGERIMFSAGRANLHIIPLLMTFWEQYLPLAEQTDCS